MVDQPKHDLTRTLLFTMFATMIATGAQYGYAIGVMNAPSELIKSYTREIYLQRYNLTISEYKQDILYATASSVIALGGVFGGLLAAPLSNRFGRKIGLSLNNIPAIIGSILMVFSKSIALFEVFIIGRILIGFSAGFGAIAGPLYITEIAPLPIRDSLAACFQLFIAMAVLLAQVLGLDICLGRKHLWNYLLAIPIGFSLLQCVLLLFTYEPPKYLLQKNRRRASEQAVQWFRCETDNNIIQAEIHEIEADFQTIQTNAMKITIRDLCSKPLLRKCLLISAMTHLAQHFTGSFVIFCFGDFILFRAHLKMHHTSYAMLSCGITYLAVTVALIFMLNKTGRRSLLLYSLIGMGIASCVIGVTILKSKEIPLHHMIFLEIFAMMAHVGFCAMGSGAIPWIISTELFSQSERVYASTIAIIVNWLSMFLTIMTFVPLFYAFGGFLFLVYGAMSGIFWFLLFLFLPETQRKTPECVQILVSKGTVYSSRHEQ